MNLRLPPATGSDCVSSRAGLFKLETVTVTVTFERDDIVCESSKVHRPEVPGQVGLNVRSATGTQAGSACQPESP